LHHAAQTIEARKDFAKLITIAKEQGQSHLAIEHMYPENAGWRVIDKHLARLRKALGIEVLDATVIRQGNTDE